MKATLTVNGNSIDIELNTEQYGKLFPEEKKKTGYDKVKEYEQYWYVTSGGAALSCCSTVNPNFDSNLYNSGNYYSSKIVAENMARAQKLWKQIHRRAVELCKPIRPNTPMFVYTISFNNNTQSLFPNMWNNTRNLGEILFDTEEHCEQTINEFHDELMWYFTEFKDRADM